MPLLSRVSPESLIQLARGSKLAHSLDRRMNSHLRTLNSVLLRIGVLLSTFLNIWIPPFESISHVHVVLCQSWTIGDGVDNERSIRLPEFNLQK